MAMGVIAFVLEKAVMRSVKKGGGPSVTRLPRQFNHRPNIAGDGMFLTRRS